jgi:dihydrolipoamide dehydrogenase
VIHLRKKIAIIGAGSAGMAAYRTVMEHTEDIVLIESDRYGTMCARAGCMPSKLLITASDKAHEAREMDQFGIKLGSVRVDGAAVMKRVRAERDDFVDHVVATVDSWPLRNRVMGLARFIAPGQLQVGADTLVEAERIVIATGSRPNVPEAWREALGDRLIVNDDIFQWERLPESVVIIGAGAVALELAQSLARLGLRIRLLSRSQRIGPLTDPVVLCAARDLLKGGFSFSEEVKEIQFRRDSGGVTVCWKDANGTEEERFEYVLAAMGRNPNTLGLDVAKAGLPLDERGRLVANPLTGQIGDTSVFLAGDVQDDRALLHEAIDAGRIAGANALSWPNTIAHQRRTPLGIVFTSPQIAMAGMTHAELCKTGTAFAAGEVHWAGQGRARIAGQQHGITRIYAGRSNGALLGAEMVGPRSEHLAHLIAWCVQMRLTVTQVLDLPFYHPVFEEGVRTALHDLIRAMNDRDTMSP